MKKIIFVLTCLLLVSACGRQTEAPPGAADCGGGPPNRIDEQFESVDELLDFVAAIDPKTYPEGYSEQHSGPAGDLEPLVSALQQDGYLLLLRSDDPGPAEQEPRYVVSSMAIHKAAGRSFHIVWARQRFTAQRGIGILLHAPNE